MVDLRRAPHVGVKIVDAFEQDVWKFCLPKVLPKKVCTSSECLAQIQAEPAVFLENVRAFAEYQILEWVGELRADHADAIQLPDTRLFGEAVLNVMENSQKWPLTIGLRAWCVFCLRLTLCRMLGKEEPKWYDKVPDPAPDTKAKKRLAKGWKTKSRS